MAKDSAPQIVALSTAQLEELLAKLAELVPVETYRLLESVLRTFQWLVGAMEAKNTTLGRLRRMIFGKQTEKTSAVLPQGAARDSDGPTKTKAKGHGRKAAQDYPGAQSVKVPHAKVTDTYWYLTGIPELLKIAGQRFEQFAGNGKHP